MQVDGLTGRCRLLHSIPDGAKVVAVEPTPCRGAPIDKRQTPFGKILPPWPYHGFVPERLDTNPLRCRLSAQHLVGTSHLDQQLACGRPG